MRLNNDYTIFLLYKIIDVVQFMRSIVFRDGDDLITPRADGAHCHALRTLEKSSTDRTVPKKWKRSRKAINVRHWVGRVRPVGMKDDAID
jgi:hypothetical protein